MRVCVYNLHDCGCKVTFNRMYLHDHQSFCNCRLYLDDESLKTFYFFSIKNTLTRSERDMCTPMFIRALFIIARTWKQPRCPSADEWIRKLWYIYTMEYYSATKKNSFESVLIRWMKLEPTIQSEVSQKDKDHCSILTHIYGI